MGRTVLFRLKFGNFLFHFRELHTSAFYQGKEFEFRDEDYMSWISMVKQCYHVGGHLPEFYSRTELEELLSLLKVRPDLPILEAIYIGLHFNIFSGASNRKILSQCAGISLY